MLDRLDTLVAFATIMLGISLLITILNQIVGALLGQRGMYLKDGIQDLIETLDPTLAAQAETIAKDVLTHKLVSDSIFARVRGGLQRWKLATSIRPEELTKVLNALSLGTAAGTYGPKVMALLNQADPALERDAKLLADTVNTAVSTAAGAGVATADQILEQVSDKANKAVGRVEAAFNSTMDRVRQRFTMQMRIWTIVFAVFFAFLYHLDAAKIYSQLGADPALRESLTKSSDDLMKMYENQTKSDLGSDAQKLADQYKTVQSKLTDSKLALFEVPQNWGDFGGPGGIFRILATAALLSLGAPFWYNALKSLVNLRSQVAEQQSKEAKG